MTPVNILQLATQGPLYGAERWVLALGRNLDPQKVKTHIAVIVDEPDQPVPLLDAAIADGFVVHPIVARGRFNFRVVTKLIRIVRDNEIAAIHSHGYKPDLAALLAARIGCSAVIGTPHGWSDKAGVKVRIYEALDRWLLRRFDAVAPLSAELARPFRSSDRVHLIPNGVDLGELTAIGPISPELARLKSSGPVIGYVGQLIARKGLTTLIKALALSNRPDGNLVLVGEGPAREELEALANRLGVGQRVHFVEFRADRLAWTCGFDLFVLPSLREGTPRCLMEAMALGVPVAATDIPGNRELVQDGVTGLAFPEDDHTALARILNGFEELVSDGQLAESGRKHIRDHFSAAAMARAYEDLYDHLLRKKRSNRKVAAQMASILNSQTTATTASGR